MALAVEGTHIDRAGRMKRRSLDRPVREESAEVAGGGPVLDRVAADLGQRRALAPPLEHLDSDAVTREPDRGSQAGEATAGDPHGLHVEASRGWLMTPPLKSRL